MTAIVWSSLGSQIINYENLNHTVPLYISIACGYILSHLFRSIPTDQIILLVPVPVLWPCTNSEFSFLSSGLWFHYYFNQQQEHCCPIRVRSCRHYCSRPIHQYDSFNNYYNYNLAFTTTSTSDVFNTTTRGTNIVVLVRRSVLKSRTFGLMRCNHQQCFHG